MKDKKQTICAKQDMINFINEGKSLSYGTNKDWANAPSEAVAKFEAAALERGQVELLRCGEMAKIANQIIALQLADPQDIVIAVANGANMFAMSNNFAWSPGYIASEFFKGRDARYFGLEFFSIMIDSLLHGIRLQTHAATGEKFSDLWARRVQATMSGLNSDEVAELIRLRSTATNQTDGRPWYDHAVEERHKRIKVERKLREVQSGKVQTPDDVIATMAKVIRDHAVLRNLNDAQTTAMRVLLESSAKDRNTTVEKLWEAFISYDPQLETNPLPKDFVVGMFVAIFMG